MSSTHDGAPRRSFRFSFGIDRLGLLALRAPYVALMLIVLVTGLAVVGVLRLNVDDSLSELFRTNTKEFQRYEEIDRRFPSSEYDVLVVVEGKDLLKRKQFTAFTNAVLGLQLADCATDAELTAGGEAVSCIQGVVSMLSARGKPDASGYAPPIVPNEFLEGDTSDPASFDGEGTKPATSDSEVVPDSGKETARPPAMPDGQPTVVDDATFEAAITALRANEIVKGKFLSDDGQLALIVLSLDRKVVAEKTGRAVIGKLQETVSEELQGSGLTFKLTGAPVMQLEIRNAVERDRLIYNGLGCLAGIIVAYLFFRRISLTLIAVAGPLIAILWTLGAIGGLDFRLNLFVNVITPLILVSGFSDSMHLVFSVRRSILAGVDRLEAARRAVIEVAPACLLTAMNASLAILSFQFAQSALIRTFGTAALMAIAISYIAVAVVVPTLAALLVRNEPAAAGGGVEEEGGVGVLQRLTDGIVHFVSLRPTVFVVLGVLAVIVTGWAHVNLKPHYRLADQVPDQEQALDANDSLDTKLTGANPVHVMIRWASGPVLYDPMTLRPVSRAVYDPAGLYNPNTLDVIAEAHKVLETQAGLGNVWSLDSLRRWLREAGDTRIETVIEYVDILPEHLVRRFIAVEETAVLVTARLPDIDASQILPIVDKIDRALAPVRAAHPSYDIAVTGLPAIAARNSANLIYELNWGLIGDMFVIFIFLGFALRSTLAGVTSILPSLLPIFMTGALLWAVGEGLQFASIIAITVAFALAIDSTIHFLNRYHLEEERLGPGVTTHQVLMATAHHIGPAVVLTTIVLALGLGVTVLSHLPSLRLFGWLTGICLFASLFAQLVILPATIVLYRRVVPRWSSPTGSPEPKTA